MQKIVLDKSFLDGASGHQVRELLAQNYGLIIEPLFYELMTSDEPIRKRRAFNKLPREAGAFTLIPNMGTFLCHEFENQQAIDSASICAIEGKHIFNEALRDGSYVPTDQVRDDILRWSAEVDHAAEIFLQLCKTVHHFFPELNGIELRELPTAITMARQAVATDFVRVRAIYEEIRSWDAPDAKIDGAMLDERWATFRFLQCHLLAALRIFGRYEGQLPETPKFRLHAEHCTHDLEYVLVASLVGAIATNDREVEEDFRMLRPDGLIVRPQPANKNLDSPKRSAAGK